MLRLLLLLALLFTTSPCFAAIHVIPHSFLTHTLEALVAESYCVGIGTVTRTNDVYTKRYKLHIDTWLKQPPGHSDHEIYLREYELNTWPEDDGKWLDKPVLIVLDAYVYQQNPPEWGVLDLVDLASADPPRSLHSPYIRDFSLTQVRSIAHFLELIREECGLGHKATEVTQFYVSHFPLQWLLADHRLDQQFQRWSDSPDPHARYLAARALEKQSDAADIPALRKLLADPYTNLDTRYLSPWTHPDYLIREAAAQTLA